MAENDAISLDAPESPEQLDRCIRITSPYNWLALLMLALIVTVVVVWSVLGQLESRAQGLGFVEQSGQENILVEATAAGTIQEVHVEAGQDVKKGDLMFTVGRGDLDLELKQARDKATRLQLQLERRNDSVQNEIKQRRALTEQKILSQRQNINAQESHAEFLRSLLSDQLEDLQLGFIKRTDVEDTRTALNTAEIEIASTRADILSDQTQLREFEDQQRNSLVELAEQVSEALAEVEKIQQQVTGTEEIRSPSDGRILELSIDINERINVGDQLALIDLAAGSLFVRGFISISDAQLVRADMPVQVALSSAAPEIYGTMLGTVRRVNPVPSSRAALMDIYENTDVVDLIMQSGPPFAIDVKLETDASTATGFKWSTSAGPPVPIASGALASVAVTYESRRPIEFVLPFIEQFLQ